MALNLMIVDDDPQLMRVLAMFFDLEGYNVIHAGNGREALALLSGHQPDLILLDLMMPEVAGEDVVKTLRATNGGPRIPIVIFTAADGREAELMAAGADAYITKPFSLDGLSEVVHEAIRQASPT
jgi:two-component system OmpR family response regulator